MTRSSSSRRESTGPDDAPDEALCRRQALNALARREHSRLELERKLSARGHGPDVISATLDRLEDIDVLNAERFCESFVRTRISRGQGPARIERELTERGIDARLAGSRVQHSTDWAELARAVRRRRFGDQVPNNYKERARQSRFLQYRGFTSEQIRAAMQGDPEF